MLKGAKHSPRKRIAYLTISKSLLMMNPFPSVSAIWRFVEGPNKMVRVLFVSFEQK